jgi:hypothetical protein
MHHRRAGTARRKLALLDPPRFASVDFDELADVVAALPFRQRAVLVLRYHARLSEREIADALGCRPGTVKSLACASTDAQGVVMTMLERDLEALFDAQTRSLGIGDPPTPGAPERSERASPLPGGTSHRELDLVTTPPRGGPPGLASS